MQHTEHVIPEVGTAVGCMLKVRAYQLLMSAIRFFTDEDV
jgi:hypothetical protein